MNLPKRYNSAEVEAALEEVADLETQVRTLQASAQPNVTVGAVSINTTGWITSLTDRIAVLRQYLSGVQSDRSSVLQVDDDVLEENR